MVDESLDDLPLFSNTEAATARKRAREYYAANKEHVKQYQRDYNKKNQAAVTKKKDEYYRRNKRKLQESSRAAARKRWAEEPEKHRAKARSDAEKYRKKNPRKKKNRALKETFNITIEDYEEMLESQGRVCAICKRPNSAVVGKGNNRARRLSVDHCHSSGRIRGLLCNGCNFGIGNFKDDPDLLRRAASYLEEIQEEAQLVSVRKATDAEKTEINENWENSVSVDEAREVVKITAEGLFA